MSAPQIIAKTPQIGTRRKVPDTSAPDGYRIESWARLPRNREGWVDKWMHGSKILLHPNPGQAAQLELWRRRAISLWNLLLGMEQAAYSGEAFRPEIHWRQIWLNVAQENYRIALKNWEEGYTVRMGPNKGKAVPPREGEQPTPPPDIDLQKIMAVIAPAEVGQPVTVEVPHPKRGTVQRSFTVLEIAGNRYTLQDRKG